MQGVEQVADANQFAAQVSADQLVQGRLLAWFEVVELAADALAVGVDRAHLKLDVDAQVEAFQLKLQAALVIVANPYRRFAGAEAEAPGGQVADRLFDALAGFRQVAQHCGDFDPRMLALGFGLMDHVDVDGCVHTCKFLFESSSGQTNARSVAMKTLAAEKVMARDDQVLNQRWKLSKPRSILVFWRVQDC